MAAFEVPGEVFVGVGGGAAGAGGGLDGVEGFEDAIFGDAFYFFADGGYARWFGHEAAHDGEDGGGGVYFVLAEDAAADGAGQNGGEGEGAEDGEGVVGVAAEEAAFL